MLARRPFGRSGHHSSRVIFGAAALGAMRQERADLTLDLVHRAGINHLDTAAGYGESELRLAPFLADHRSEVFLATKTGERTASGARAELERSLQRMGVDSVDLIQLHNLVEDDEWRVAHGPGGALQALVAARDEGLVRFIGVTGHGTRIPRVHLRSLAEFDYDSVLFPYNPTMLQRADYATAVDDLLGVCAQRDVAVQTIKSVARGRWPADSTEPHFAWYQPLQPGPAFDHAVRFVLSNPQVFLNSTSDARLLPELLRVADGEHHDRPSDAELQADMAEEGITALFDGGALERI